MQIIKTVQEDSTHVILTICLENGEDTQYPLEDLLDKYLVDCEELEEQDDIHYVVSLFSDDPDIIDELLNLKGKRVYNELCGDAVDLIIE